MSSNKIVYLAGNIAGLTYEDAIAWRTTAAQKLESHGYICLDPMRDKQHLSGSIVGFTHNSQNCSAEEIFKRDIDDVNRANIVLANISTFSIGTAFELGYAYSLGKIIVVAASGAVLDHPFLTESANYYTPDLDAGIEYITKLTSEDLITTNMRVYK
jgi:nucleoside 2-deoxyribosyltransferase